jgi:hydrophobic/amphiphilic exporter-1 (mainly G- bacteria), HAE1 family
MSVREAVIEGGRRRLRPILMTAVATIFALLPMALGLTGSGGFISQPVARQFTISADPIRRAG